MPGHSKTKDENGNGNAPDDDKGMSKGQRIAMIIGLSAFGLMLLSVLFSTIWLKSR